MHIVKVSSQRQITLPQRLLARIGVKKHDNLSLEVKGDVLVVKPRKTTLVEELSGSLLPYIKPELRGKSMKEIMRVTRKRVAEHLAHE